MADLHCLSGIRGSEPDCTALVYTAGKPDLAGVTVILGHGAGADQNSDFMTRFATGLAARGINVVTFNFLYTEQGRRVPDANKALEACFRAVIEAVLLSPGCVFRTFPAKNPPGMTMTS
jgi:hypothetical protein